MEVTGKVKLVKETEVISEKFQKRELILTDDSNADYPQHLCIQFTQKNVDILDGLKPNDEVKVHINLRGREWTSPKGEVRYFNTIEGWRVENINSGESPTLSSVGTPEKDDDLPF
jgi:hypothetical protein